MIVLVLPQVSHVMSADQIVQLIVPLIIKASKDSVPNVRFCACRTITWILENHSLGGSVVDSVIKPALSELEHDTDIDVQYYASRAMAACGNSWGVLEAPLAHLLL